MEQKKNFKLHPLNIAGLTLIAALASGFLTITGAQAIGSSTKTAIEQAGQHQTTKQARAITAGECSGDVWRDNEHSFAAGTIHTHEIEQAYLGYGGKEYLTTELFVSDNLEGEQLEEQAWKACAGATIRLLNDAKLYSTLYAQFEDGSGNFEPNLSDAMAAVKMGTNDRGFSEEQLLAATIVWGLTGKLKSEVELSANHHGDLMDAQHLMIIKDRELNS